MPMHDGDMHLWQREMATFPHEVWGGEGEDTHCHSRCRPPRLRRVKGQCRIHKSEQFKPSRCWYTNDYRSIDTSVLSISFVWYVLPIVIFVFSKQLSIIATISILIQSTRGPLYSWEINFTSNFTNIKFASNTSFSASSQGWCKALTFYLLATCILQDHTRRARW